MGAIIVFLRTLCQYLIWESSIILDSHPDGATNQSSVELAITTRFQGYRFADAIKHEVKRNCARKRNHHSGWTLEVGQSVKLNFIPTLSPLLH